MGGNRRYLLSAEVIVYVVLVLIVLTMIAHPQYVVVAQKETPLDPAPLLKLLQDTLSLIIGNQYGSASSLCSESLNVSLPPDVSYLHVRLYERLLKLSKLMEKSGRLVREASAGSPKVKEVIYELYGVKIELEDLISDYVGRLSKYFKDSATRYVMMRYSRELINELMIKVDNTINNLIKVYLQGGLNITKGKRLLYILISVPDKIEGGKDFNITLTIKALANISEVNTSLTVIFANAIVKDLVTTLPVNESIVITMKAPQAEELMGGGVKLSEELPVKITVVAKGVLGNETIADYVSVTSTLTYSRPPCTFSIPSIIYPNQSMKIHIISRAEMVLNLTVYINKLESKYLLLKSLIKPGDNVFIVKLKNLTVGLHKLIFVTEPKGPYLGLTYSATFTVIKPPLTAIVNTRGVVIAPPFTSPLYVYVNIPIPYKLIVYVGNAKVLEHTYTNKSKVALNLPIPFTLLMWRYEVKVEVQALNPKYGSVVRSLTIYVINLPLLIAAVIASGFAMIASVSSSRYVSFSLKSLIHGLRKALIVSGELKEAVKPVEAPIPRFRRPRLLKLYRRFLRIISKYVGLPKRSETLREFYRRLSMRISDRLRKLVGRFLSMYEVDLYSSHEVDIGKAEEVIRRLEEVGSE